MRLRPPLICASSSISSTSKLLTPAWRIFRFEEIFESRQRFLEGHVAAPMKQIEVDLLDIETAKASIAGRGHALAGRVLWIELRHDEHLIAQAGDRLADEPLRASVRIHLGCVDERHAELDPAAQRGNLVLAFARGLAHAPGALPEDGHGSPPGSDVERIRATRRKSSTSGAAMT